MTLQEAHAKVREEFEIDFGQSGNLMQRINEGDIAEIHRYSRNGGEYFAKMKNGKVHKLTKIQFGYLSLLFEIARAN